MSRVDLIVQKDIKGEKRGHSSVEGEKSVREKRLLTPGGRGTPGMQGMNNTSAEWNGHQRKRKEKY